MRNIINCSLITFSNSFSKQEQRLTGLYEDGDDLSLVVLNRRITIICFHMARNCSANKDC